MLEAYAILALLFGGLVCRILFFFLWNLAWDCGKGLILLQAVCSLVRSILSNNLHHLFEPKLSLTKSDDNSGAASKKKSHRDASR